MKGWHLSDVWIQMVKEGGQRRHEWGTSQSANGERDWLPYKYAEQEPGVSQLWFYCDQIL